MPPRQPILFVCTHNLSRSYTAEYLYRDSPAYEARSAGTDQDARIPLSAELVGWATRIFVMEPEHLAVLEQRFGERLDGKEIVCLGIPDDYAPLEPALITLLQERLSPFLSGGDSVGTAGGRQSRRIRKGRGAGGRGRRDRE